MNVFGDTVEVPCGEIEELKRQAEEINRRIKELSAPKQIACYVTERPLSTPRNLKDDEPVFGYIDYVDQDAWNAFIKLAKTVHTKSPQFYMSSTHPSMGGRPYIRSTCSKTPRTIEQLSADQVRISAEMLNEMVAIYNRYYVMLHEQVVYDPRDGSGAQFVDVIPPQPDREVR